MGSTNYSAITVSGPEILPQLHWPVSPNVSLAEKVSLTQSPRIT